MTENHEEKKRNLTCDLECFILSFPSLYIPTNKHYSKSTVWITR